MSLIQGHRSTVHNDKKNDIQVIDLYFDGCADMNCCDRTDCSSDICNDNNFMFV